MKNGIEGKLATYNFTVSLADSENILSFIRDKIWSNHECIMDTLMELAELPIENILDIAKRKDLIAHLKIDNEYIKDLLDRVSEGITIMDGE